MVEQGGGGVKKESPGAGVPHPNSLGLGQVMEPLSTPLSPSCLWTVRCWTIWTQPETDEGPGFTSIQSPRLTSVAPTPFPDLPGLGLEGMLHTSQG